MSSTSHGPEGAQDLIDLISTEIHLAREETRPTSRQELAHIVNARTGMPLTDAFEFVDRYCDENEPGVPGYLQEEFAIPYLKVVAVFFAIVAMVLCYNGVSLYRTAHPWWIWVTIGVLFFGAAALSWVKSLEREWDFKKKKQK
jgi:hypothetical protein